MLPRRVEREAIVADAGGAMAVRDFTVPAFLFRWHYHPEIELTLIVRGRGLRYVGDSVGDYREGDLCLLGENLPHTWSSAPREGTSVRTIVVQFPRDFLADAVDRAPQLRGVKDLLARARRGLWISGQTAAIVGGLMEGLSALPAASARRCALLLEILAILSESDELTALTAGAQAPLLSPGAQHRLGAVLQRLHAAPDQIPRQHEAAALAGMSGPVFSRFFRRHLGVAYCRYVNQVRTATACRALLETQAPITDIAFDAGFENLSNFNRRFRQIKGCTPSDYRRQVLVASRRRA